MLFYKQTLEHCAGRNRIGEDTMSLTIKTDIASKKHMVLVKKTETLLEDGKISPNHLHRFLEFSEEEREKAIEFVQTIEERNRRITDKFEMVQKLGVIEVPENDLPERRMTRFRELFGKRVEYLSPCLTDENCKPSEIIRPGEKIEVSLYMQCKEVTQTSNMERLGFLEKIESLLLGAHGTVLVYEHLREQIRSLPPFMNYHIYSLDRPESLWVDNTGQKRLSGMMISTNDGHSHINHSYDSYERHHSHLILSFKRV